MPKASSSIKVELNRKWFSPRLSVLVPWRPGDPERERLAAWVRTRLALTLPEAQVVTHDGGQPWTGDVGAFNHPRAINEARRQANGNVLLIVDSDTALDPRWVREAAWLVASRHVPWVLPTHYEQLTRDSTRVLLRAGLPEEQLSNELEREWVGDRVSWSGGVVILADAFDALGGYDERYEHWGADDVAFGLKANTLHGEVFRLEGAAVHLWHSRAGIDVQPLWQQQLTERYMSAVGDRARMLEVS